MVEKIPLKKALATLNLPAVLGFGNPLLDIVMQLHNTALLRKYNLKVDDQVEISAQDMRNLIVDLPLQATKKITAGGCAQNTMRVLQWIYDDTHTSQIGNFYGCIGNDIKGKLLEQLVSTDGVNAKYVIHPTLPTGICVSLVSKSARCLIANIGAAKGYLLNHLVKDELHLDTVKIIYIEGFFITHSLNVAKELVRLAKEKDIIIAFNLNGEYIFKDHHAAICEMVGLAKIVFGNANEMKALAQALNVQYDDVTDIPFLLNSLKRITVDVSHKVSRDWLTDDGIFVMTQGGAGPAITVWGKGESVQVHPIIPKLPILDTTGAGDSLVAGFFAGILANWDPKSCLECGCKTAASMITTLGVSLPDVSVEL